MRTRDMGHGMGHGKCINDMQGTFLLLHLLTRVAFKLDATYSFINASCVTDLGLEVEAFREAMCGCSSLGCRVRIDLIGRDCE